MTIKSPADLSRLCIHTITTKPLDFENAVYKYASLNVSGITVWREAYSDIGPVKAGKLIKDSGLNAVSLCRGGFFPSVDKEKRRLAIADNLAALDEAYDLGVPMVVLVCGADPAQSLDSSREQIRYGIEAILPKAEEFGIKLAIEPLHPVYADTRSAINTMAQANDLVDYFDSPWVGVAVDVYHVWWDQNLKKEIDRCGEGNKIFAFHICDWKVPVIDVLNDRGIMGEGIINIPQIRQWVEDSGFDGFNEVEIFSDLYWKTDQDIFLNKILDAYYNHV